MGFFDRLKNAVNPQEGDDYENDGYDNFGDDNYFDDPAPAQNIPLLSRASPRLSRHPVWASAPVLSSSRS